MTSMHVRQVALLMAITASLTAGCAGYQIGGRSLFRQDVATIHVPVFQCDDLRRNLGERLTEAVVREIEAQTPYKLVHYPNADSVLQGKILSVRKRALAENQNDELRNVELTFAVQVTWIDRQGNPLMQRADIAIPPLAIAIAQSANFVPEAGQSVATAQQTAIERLAEQIVAQMHIRW